MVVPVALQYKLKSFNSLFCDILSVISAEWCAAAKTGFYCTKNCFPRSTDQPIFATHTSEMGKKSSENGRSTSQPAFTTYTH